MIHIIKQKKIKKKQLVCDIGDIIYGEKYFIKPQKTHYGDRKFLSINSISYNVWDSLEVLGIDFEDFKKEVSYICPYTKNTYFWAIPIYLFSDRVDEIVDDTQHIPWKQMYKDHEWAVDFYFKKYGRKEKSEFVATSIHEAFLGPGYTSGTRPCDGGGNLKDAVIDLDNGDQLGCKVWVWYNK
jgi:hypothetical protein